MGLENKLSSVSQNIAKPTNKSILQLVAQLDGFKTWECVSLKSSHLAPIQQNDPPYRPYSHNTACGDFGWLLKIYPSSKFDYEQTPQQQGSTCPEHVLRIQ